MLRNIYIHAYAGRPIIHNQRRKRRESKTSHSVSAMRAFVCLSLSLSVPFDNSLAALSLNHSVSLRTRLLNQRMFAEWYISIIVFNLDFLSTVMSGYQ
jgi:hypothetical protein